MKRLISLALAGVMALSLAACGGAPSQSGSTPGSQAQSGGTAGKKLVVWTLAEDLKDFAAHYTEQTGVDVEVNVIAPAD